MSGKKGRPGISLDMTAMCDMALLLLTFFILTAKMKAPEKVSVDVPAVEYEKVKSVPEKNMLRITLNEQGYVYFGLTEPSTRRKMIDEVNKAKKLNLTEAECIVFSNTEIFGVPMNKLKGFLNLSQSKRDEYYNQPIGIPVDSVNNELRIWVKAAKTINPQLIIAVKGDKDSEYKNYVGVVKTLQSLRLNKFSSITVL